MTVNKKRTILAHIQDEWGDHLYITKEVLDKDKLDDIDAYLKDSVRRSKNPEWETNRSIQLRSSIKIEKREAHYDSLDTL